MSRIESMNNISFLYHNFAIMYDIFMNEQQCKKRKEIHDGGELQENKKLF